MKKKYFVICTILLLQVVLSVNVSYAQQSNKAVDKNINTTIVDQFGDPVPDVQISINSGLKETKSDKDGAFSIGVPENSKLLFEAKGYKSRVISSDSLNNSSSIKLSKMLYGLGEDEYVNVPFGKLQKRRVVGDVTTINPSQILNYDNTSSLVGALNGRVPGLYNGFNIRGLGNALIVVDGIPRENLPSNVQEIDEITVLKDVGSRILYGKEASDGVILINTKKGQVDRNDFKATVKTGIRNPISYPDYLSAGRYMELYNEARVNDGLTPLYDSTAIANTKNGTNRIRYPDKRYYSSTYLNDFSSFWNVVTEASGGNEQGKYYLNVGWNRDNSLLKLGDGGDEQRNQLNARGNASYKINENMTFDMGIAAKFNFYHTYSSNPGWAGDGNFWHDASEQLPNEFPDIIPVSAISDSSIINSANLVDGQYLLGGTNQFRNNIYGNLTKTGYSNQLDRSIQMNTGLNVDLDFITKGLSSSGYVAFDIENFYNNFQQNDYAVYEPNYVSSAGGDSLTLSKYGQDVITGAQNINNATFRRNFGFYGTINYDRSFNDVHDITATGLAYRRQVDIENQIQSDKYLHFGLRANYTYDNKYIVEFNGAMVGSPALYNSDKYAISPSVTLGWVASEESFLNNSSVINYLKLNAGYGIANTDQGINSTRLHETTYRQRWNFPYNQTSGNQNRWVSFNTVGNPNIGWVQREELNIGFNSVLLNNSVNLNANYFRSSLSGIYEQLNNSYPAFIAGVIPYQNHGIQRDEGVEVGLTVNKDISSSLNVSLGANIMHNVPKAVKVDEPNYDLDYLEREGKPYDARFGYVSQGLFQSQQEINNHAEQTFGPVQPGDIKYKDLNGDGFIDARDQKMIGNYRPRNILGVHLNVQYKSLELFALGRGQSGSDTYFNSSYYWVYGNRKYSEKVLNRWTPETAETATYPRLSSQSNPNNFRNSTYWLRQDNWFKIETAQLTYTLPQEVTNNMAFKKLRIYLRGSNLLTISNIKEHLDMNVGSAPQTRNFSLGIITSF